MIDVSIFHSAHQNGRLEDTCVIHLALYVLVTILAHSAQRSTAYLLQNKIQNIIQYLTQTITIAMDTISLDLKLQCNLIPL